jgi:hypothetical protein
LGGRGAEQGLQAELVAPHQLCTTFSGFRALKAYQWTLKPALMRLLPVVWPKSLTAVVTWSGP